RMTGGRSSRFALLADYDIWAPRWTGRVAWAARATQPEWFEIVERATPRERSVFSFPAPGDPYWDEQTLADTQARYPGADLTPYRWRGQAAAAWRAGQRSAMVTARPANGTSAASTMHRAAAVSQVTGTPTDSSRVAASGPTVCAMPQQVPNAARYPARE